MIPLNLTIHSFGPFAGQEVIDFQKLGEHKLFLIYGPTGSGKTTILDAMCYALYGTTSGDGRSGAAMRSEYASPKEATEVAFTFAIGEKTYRAVRSPEQQIAKKRGTGTKKAAAKAALYEITAAGEEKPLATKNVTAAVEALLGFKAEQFRQVVLLPQGEFRRLLLANSSERQQIMQTLFHTWRYERLQELAKKRHDELADRYAAIKAKREQVLAQLQIEDESKLRDKQAAWQEEIEKAENALQAAIKENAAQQQALQAAKVLANQYTTLRTSEAAASQLQQEAAAVEAKRQEVQRLRQAQILAEPCQQLDEIEARGRDAAKKEETAKAKAGQAEKDWQAISQAKAQSDQQEGAYKQAAADVVTLQQLTEKVAAYTACQENTKKAAVQAAVTQQAYQKLSQARTAKAAQLEKTRQRISSLSDWAVAAAAARQQIQSLEEAFQREKKGLALQAKIAAAVKQSGQRQKDADQAAQKAREAQVQYEALQFTFLQSQAAFLASTLAEGQACPVCGAMHHPKLAVLPEAVPQKEDVERQKRRAEACKGKEQETAAAWSASQAQQAALEKQYADFAAEYTLQGCIDGYPEKLAQAEKEAKNWETKVAQGQKLQAQIEQDQEALKALEAKETKAQQAANEAQQQAVQVKAQLQHLEQEIPASYRDAAALAKQLQGRRSFVAAYEKQRVALQQKLVTAEREKTQTQEQAASWHQQAETLRQRFYDGTQALRQRALDAGFDSVKKLRAKQPFISQIPVLEKEITAYEAKVQQVQGTMAQMRKLIGAQAEPEIGQYEAKARQAQQAEQRLAEAKGTLASQYGQWQQAVAQLRQFGQAAQALTEKYKTVGAVYELIAGKQTGINFERYVLGALLDEVLQAANERLQAMSRQRYLLQRSTAWQDKRVKQIGLDIAVFDNYTGYARAANTLSGGETFLASLSLALGLADVVQAYSGGIHLDTIFIDEGFGTLDEETLDYALKTLMSLKRGGRLVGIISHVGELKERIDARLAVKKTDRGSTTAFEFD